MDNQDPALVYEKPQPSKKDVFVKHTLPFTTLRFFQFASAVIVMSLIAFAIHSYDFHGSERANFALSVGVMGTFYILAVFFLTILMPKLVFCGVYLIAECIMCLLWLCGFIVSAKVFGQHSCSLPSVTVYNPSFGSLSDFQASGGEFNPFTGQYTTSSHKTACQATKASIAFSGLSFILGILSCLLLGLNVIAPIARVYGGKGLWKTGTSMGTQLHRSAGLSLTRDVVQPNVAVPGDENYVPPQSQEAAAQGTVPAGAYVPDQHTMSTTGESTNNGSYNNNQEKFVEQPGAARVSGVTATSETRPAFQE